jgi:hypothetical protein
LQPVRDICFSESAIASLETTIEVAANSREKPNSVAAWIITALDTITAFAVPNLNGLAEPSVFSGLAALRVVYKN